MNKVTLRPFLVGLLAALGLMLGACATPSPAGTGFAAALDRSVCFGACPDYSVTIASDGAVTYVGRNFVLERGERRGRADPEDIARLRAMARSAGFFRLRDDYRARVTDLPTTTLAISDQGRTKTVIDYGGAMVGMPDSVRALQDEVDRVAGTARWIRGEGANGELPAK